MKQSKYILEITYTKRKGKKMFYKRFSSSKRLLKYLQNARKSKISMTFNIYERVFNTVRIKGYGEN